MAEKGAEGGADAPRPDVEPISTPVFSLKWDEAYDTEDWLVGEAEVAAMEAGQMPLDCRTVAAQLRRFALEVARLKEMLRASAAAGVNTLRIEMAVSAKHGFSLVATCATGGEKEIAVVVGNTIADYLAQAFREEKAATAAS